MNGGPMIEFKVRGAQRRKGRKSKENRLRRRGCLGSPKRWPLQSRCSN